ncbi:MAG: SIMPL domain-containing protein [Gammaproteobacteria bacterium]|nr:SIMPL domain-containing protein [Gammaproteobacteria bacterium]
MISRTTVFMILLGLVFSAAAHDEPVVHYDHITLSANASKEVPQDELQVTLYAVSDSEEARTSADEVGTRIHKALSILNSEAGISTQTGSFNTHPVYKKQKITGWRSRQTLEVKSTNAKLLSELIGRVQNYVLLENIRYNVSEQVRRFAENQLIEEAMENFQHRARLVTSNLRREKYRVVDMNISTSHPRPNVMQARAMASLAEAAPAPDIQAGKQHIQVNINGTIEVQLKNK